MIVALSPYLLTTREPAALVSMLLADHVVTMVPAPEAVTRQAVGEAAGRVTRYLELLESWSWSMPLWHAGVVGSDYMGEDAIDDVRDVRREIEADDRFAALRPLMHSTLEFTDDVYLQRFAGDLLKGGPDPALSVPVAAGIDRFAGRNGLVVARSEPASVAAKQEAQMLAPLARFAMPAIVQSGGQRILAAREDLAEPLDVLRDAIEEGDEPGVRAAAGEYSAAFDELREDLTRTVDPDDPKTVAGMVSVTLGELPTEAVQQSSCVAAGRMLGRAAAFEPQGTGAAVRTMVVRQMGVRSRR